MKPKVRIYLFVLIIIIFSTLLFSQQKVLKQNPHLVGIWEGYGHEIVDWCDADSVYFYINIFPNGKVEGKVGDAILQNGYIKKNFLFNRLFGNPQYLIGGDLEGSIIENEDIYRKKLQYLMVTYKNGKLVGGFNTSGSKGNPIGDKKSRKEKMKITGVNVYLKKIK